MIFKSINIVNYSERNVVIENLLINAWFFSNVKIKNIFKSPKTHVRLRLHEIELNE